MRRSAAAPPDVAAATASPAVNPQRSTAKATTRVIDDVEDDAGSQPEANATEATRRRYLRALWRGDIIA